MERQFNACQTPRSMYLSIFNSFRVIRCLSQRVSAKIAIFDHILVSPWDAPGEITLNVVWMKREFDAYKLSRSSEHVPIYLQQFPSYSNRKCKKSALFTYRSPHFCFPWRRPCDYHAICCMDGKKIQCLPNPLQNVPVCVQYFRSYRMLKSMRKSKNRYFYHISVSPGDAPEAITLNFVWMEREFDAYKLSCCMCPSNYKRF